MSKGSAIYNPDVQSDIDMQGHNILNPGNLSLTSGYSGYSGYSSTSGYSGYSSTSGYSGYSGGGTSGFSGYSSRSGYSGYSSTSGFSGFSGPGGGASGTSGYSGYSSVSGFSGYSASPDILQNSQVIDYTTVASDDGKHLLHPASDNNPRTFSIAANASVPYAIGACITFVNEINVLSIAINSDTMTLANTSTTGTRSLALNGIATAIKTGTTKWLISGVGLT